MVTFATAGIRDDLLPLLQTMPLRTLVAIDPGDVHQGVALFNLDSETCVDAFETRRQPLLDFLSIGSGSGLIEAAVWEAFILEPARAPMLAGTELETAQMIGAMKYAINGRAVTFSQTNKIKKPTRSVLRAKKVRAVAKANGAGGHAADAELHGWYCLIHEYGVAL